MSKNKQLVLAIFNTEADADAAVTSVKTWDKASDDVKLGAIGVLVKDDKGKIKTHKLGKRKTGAGAVLGAIAAGIATGGLSLVGGAVVGGILGSFFHKGLGMSKDDMTRIDSELDGGRAIVAILAENDEAEAVSAKLAELGGQPETHEVSDEALEQAAAAVEEAAPAEEDAAAVEETAPAEPDAAA